MNFTFRFFVSIFGDQAFWTNIKVFIVYLNIWRWGFWTILYNWMCNYYLLIDGLLSQNLDNNNSSILRTERDDIMAMRRLQFIALHWTKNPILSSSDAAGSGKKFRFSLCSQNRSVIVVKILARKAVQWFHQ